MSRFEQVSVVKKANIYFDGKVPSRTVEFACLSGTWPNHR